jgi:hypothetical protein
MDIRLAILKSPPFPSRASIAKEKPELHFPESPTLHECRLKLTDTRNLKDVEGGKGAIILCRQL